MYTTCRQLYKHYVLPPAVNSNQKKYITKLVTFNYFPNIHQVN